MILIKFFSTTFSKIEPGKCAIKAPRMRLQYKFQFGVTLNKLSSNCLESIESSAAPENYYGSAS